MGSVVPAVPSRENGKQKGGAFVLDLPRHVHHRHPVVGETEAVGWREECHKTLAQKFSEAGSFGGY
jgi:hypothetical protein